MKNNLKIAQEKAEFEIQKEIKKIKELCKLFSGNGELFFYIYYLHVIRILKMRELDLSVEMGLNSFDDICKYLIPCILKYGKKTIIKNEYNSLINIPLTELLTGTVKHINSNYESKHYLSLIDNITVFGERNQHVKIDMSEFTESQNYNFLKYGSRFQTHIHNQKSNISKSTSFLKLFREEFILYDSLIEKEFGLNLDNIILLLNFILNHITQQLAINMQNCPKLKNENIDIQSQTTLIETIKSFSLEKDVFLNKLQFETTKFLEKLTYNPDNFDIQQLGYPMILRQPIIKLDSIYIISPELLLDSLFINFHYTLLESNKVKHTYKKSFSGFFLDKITKISAKYDYVEKDREIELYSGKKKLGDIDLIFYNKKVRSISLNRS